MTMEERIEKIKNEYPEVMTQKEFAEALGVSHSIAYRLNRDGVVPYGKLQKGLVRYYQISKDDVIRYIEGKYRHWSEKYVAAGVECLTKMLEDEPEILCTKDIMRIAGVSKTTANNWMLRGRIKGFKYHRGFLVKKEDFVKFMASPMYQSSNRIGKRAKEITAVIEEYIKAKELEAME